MLDKSWKKVLLVAVACAAVLALVTGIAVAVTDTGQGKACRSADGGDSGNGCQSGECGNASASHGPGTLLGHRDQVRDEIAGLLGLSLEDMTAELKSGKTLAELAREKGVSTEQVLETITAKVGEVLGAEVAAGNVTPERAEDIKSMAAERAASCIENGCRGDMGRNRGNGSCGCGGSQNGE